MIYKDREIAYTHREIEIHTYIHTYIQIDR